MLLFTLLLVFYRKLAEPFLFPQLSPLTLPRLPSTMPAFLFDPFLLDLLFIFTAFVVEVLQAFLHRIAISPFDSLNPRWTRPWQQNRPIDCRYFFFCLPDRHKCALSSPRPCLTL